MRLRDRVLLWPARQRRLWLVWVPVLVVLSVVYVVVASVAPFNGPVVVLLFALVGVGCGFIADQLRGDGEESGV
ncbi:hypothetical protein [Auritidibacter ignavus]|uniref:hypothetical protein n=1 Tax=Auritidibacter ignavus TaxID=678932 RepID=UPI002FE586A9